MYTLCVTYMSDTQDMCVTHIWVTHKKSRTSSWQINVYVVCHSHVSDTQETHTWVTQETLARKRCVSCVSLTCEWHTRHPSLACTRCVSCVSLSRPAPMNHVKYLRAGPAEMPFRNWYTANTNHFTTDRFCQVEPQKTTELSNKSSNA